MRFLPLTIPPKYHPQTSLHISTKQEHFTNFVNNMQNVRRVNLDPTLEYW